MVTVEDEDELAEIQLMFGTVWLPWRTRMILLRFSLCLRQCGYPGGRDSAYDWDSVVTLEVENYLTEKQLMFETVWLLWRSRMILPRSSLCLGQCGYFCRYLAYVWNSVVTLEDEDDLAERQFMFETVWLLLPIFSL